MPLRGKPKEYLATNKVDARKVLARQISLYHQEQDTKAKIVKAMNKLFSNGHVSLLKDLPQVEECQNLLTCLEEVMTKKIQICWLMKFQD